MFACDLRTLSLIFLFALMINEIVSSPEIPVEKQEFSRVCRSDILYMKRIIGKPPSQENYWDGSFYISLYPGLRHITIRLKLIAPAEVTVLYPKNGKVDVIDGIFVLTVTPLNRLSYKILKIHVEGEEGGIFPNVQSLTLNGDDVCPNPRQWKPTILGATVSKDIEVSNNDSKKDTKVGNNDSEKDTEVENTDSEKNAKVIINDAEKDTQISNKDSEKDMKVINNDSEKDTQASNDDSKKETKVNNKDTALKCGKRLVNHQELIKGGELTKEGDWPWHAAIFHQEGVNSYAYKCGGVLLNKNTVLTAAHCVVQSGRAIVTGRVSVKLGLHHRFVGGVNTQEFQVYRIISHENFNSTYLYNDIAMLKLSTEATYTNYVQPVCLWPEADDDISSLVGKPGDVIGWGFYDKQNELSDYLGYGTMPIVSSIKCLESNRPFFGLFVSSRTFCAGYRNGTSVCNGDSGGGMFFERDGAYLLRGLVSISVSLRNEQVCNPYEYVIFTDVAQYLNWIWPKL